MSKKTLLLFVASILLVGYVAAQDFVTTRPQKKAVVLEEYTGINCPYCPQGHAVAEGIHDDYPEKTFIINVHVGYYATPSEGQLDLRTEWGDALVGQTALEGYPSGTVNRHSFSDIATSGGTALSRDAWPTAADRIFDESSYVNVGISTSYNDVTREISVTVETYYVENLPFGVEENFLNIALLESGVVGYQAGGSSSYNHKHILRDLLTDQWGEEIEGIEAGSVVTKTYTYTVDEDFIVENCTLLAFVTQGHQEIITGAEVPVIDGLNDGEIEADYARLFVDNTIEAGDAGQMSEFNLTMINGLNEDQDFTLTLNHNAPEDWTVSFTVNDVAYTADASVALTPDEVKQLTINVTPSETVGAAQCELVLTSVDYPAETEKIAEVFVVSGVDNLIINGSGASNDVVGSDYENYYKSSLTEAGCTTVGAIPGYTVEEAFLLGLFTDVENIYFNISGTTPVLTVGQTQALQDFVDNGGNLLIAGQDIGWDIMGLQATSGAFTMKSFYQNYLSTSFLNDGESTNDNISSTIDSIYSGIGDVTLINVSGGDFDPDELKAFDDAVESFFYPNGKAAAIRSYKGSSRIIYMGFGLEQISDEDVRNDIMDRTYRWFLGWEGSGIESDVLTDVNVYPNPVVDVLRIDSDLKDGTYSIYTIIGQNVKTGNFNGNTSVDLSEIISGIYILEINQASGSYKTKFTKQ